MVTVTDYQLRTTDESRSFYVLVLQGDLDFILSEKTGKFYATIKRAYMPTTFDEMTCQLMIGRQMPGSIEKVPCDPYEYTIKDTGEVISLNFRNEYVPENQPAQTIPGFRDMPLPSANGHGLFHGALA